MAWWDTWREAKRLAVAERERKSLAREFEDTAAELVRQRKAFATVGTFTDVELGQHQQRVTALEGKLIELRSRGIGEGRAIGGLPWVENDSRIPYGSGGPAHPSQLQAGFEQGLRLAPVYAAARLLADGVASLPLYVYRPDNNGAPQRYQGPTIFSSGSSAEESLGRGPSVTGTLYDWLFSCMSSLVLDGNAFGYIAGRDGYEYPTAIEWFDPQLIYIDEGITGGPPNPLQARFYYEGREVPRSDMFHVRAFTVPGQVRGISPLRAFVSLVNQGLNTQQYGADWFANGGFPPGIMRNTLQEVNTEQSAEIKSMLVSAIRRHQPLVIGVDWDYKPVSVPPSEAQFIEATQMNATQIAAVYGVPAHRIGGTRGSMTYSNVEAETISFLTDTLRPWLVRLESAFYGILPAQRYARFHTDSMIRTDTKTRHEIYQIDREIGLRGLDEMRLIEDLPPLKKGKGKSDIPLQLGSDLSRSGKAVPTIYADEVTVLETPPGATPGAPAMQKVETPQADELSQTGTPDQATPGAGGPGGAGNTVTPAAKNNPAAKTAASGGSGSGANGTGRKPATAPSANGTPRSFSVAGVAQEWAGPAASDPARFRAYLAETGREAKRHGITFGNYMQAAMTEEQAGWLLGFMRGHGEPEDDLAQSVNGNSG